MDNTNPRSNEDKARPRRPLMAWFDVRGRRVGSWAFALNRLTGIGLVVYLFLHLVVLSTLLGGPDGYDQFIALARNPLFLSLDVVLIFGMLFHGLNGIRVGLVGLGVGVRRQKALFWWLAGTGLILLIAATAAIFSH